MAPAGVLKQLQIWGFKAIKDSGPIDLGPFTLLIGRNGSGKSSLIEALQWLQRANAGGLREATWPFESFDDLLNRRSEVMAIEAIHGEGTREIRYGLTVEAAKTGPVVQSESCREGRTRAARWTIKSRRISGTSVRYIEDGPTVRDEDALALSFVTKTKAKGAERLLDFLRNAVFLRLSPTAIAGRGVLLPSTRGPLLDEEGRDVVALLNRLDDEERKWLVTQIAEVIEGVEGIEVVEQGPMLGYFKARQRMRSRGGTKVFDVPAWLLSEGTRRITAIFGLLAMKRRPSAIIIEEIENGLDPWTLRFVLDGLRNASSEGVQIILTTHSPFLLDHVEPNEILHVRRTNGDTIYEPMTSFDEVVRYQRIVTPGAMYVGGYMRDAETDEEG